MQVNGIIVEEINELGELKSFVLNKDYNLGDLWIAFPDEYETHREGPFHFLNEQYQKLFSTVYENVQMRKIGGSRFKQLDQNTFIFSTNWDNIPVKESYELYYYSLFLPKFAYPHSIDFDLSIKSGWGREDQCKVVKDNDRYVIYILCKGSEDRYHKPPLNLTLNIRYEISKEIFENQPVRNLETVWQTETPLSNQEFLRKNHLLEGGQYEKLEKLFELLGSNSLTTNGKMKLSQIGALKKKILFVGANPFATTRLRIDEEYREIDNGLRLSNGREQFELSISTATRPNDLRREILRHEPNFVHFSGHGDYEGIVLEDAAGDPALVSGDALSDLFYLFKDKTECVILNSCYSEEQAKGICQNIPFVIGMKKAVPDNAAIQFSVGFYDAIGAGKNINDAFRFGRNAIALNNLSGADIPILLRK